LSGEKMVSLRLSFSDKDDSFYNLILRSLYELLEKKGEPSELGGILSKADAKIEVLNVQESKYVQLHTIFRKPKVLPSWLK
jgi:hypothetical protein